MPIELSLTLSPKQASEEPLLKAQVAEKLNISVTEVTGVRIIRKSIDARGRQIKVNLGLSVFVNEAVPAHTYEPLQLKNVALAEPVVIVGAGPAGLFAALRLPEHGVRPII